MSEIKVYELLTAYHNFDDEELIVLKSDYDRKVKLLEAEILRQELLLKVFGEGRVSINELGDCTVSLGDRVVHLWKGRTITFENLDLAVIVEHLTPKPSEG
jgi:hypothetical protein